MDSQSEERQLNGEAWIRREQAKWARTTQLEIDGAGYCQTPDLNLPWLTDQIRADLLEGDGNEFGIDGSRGKICALHSSSALAVNMFGYWATRPDDHLADVLRIRSGIESIRFERKFPTGIGRRSPNLDVVIYARDKSLLAIESKFGEPFRKAGAKPFQEKYFPADRNLWAEVGLYDTQRAAEQIRTDQRYEVLDARQILSTC
jgi:hypothetical protein